MTDDKLRELERKRARQPLPPASREIRIARTRARERTHEPGIELPGLER